MSKNSNKAQSAADTSVEAGKVGDVESAQMLLLTSLAFSLLAIHEQLRRIANKLEGEPDE
jgi:hypothetical protein